MKHILSERCIAITLVFALAIGGTIVSGEDAIPTQEKRRPIPLGPPEETSLFVAYTDRGEIRYSSRLLQLGGFDAKTGKNIRHLDLYGFNALNAMFSPDGKYWITSSGDEAELRDGLSGKIKANLRAKGGRIAAINIGEKSDCFVVVSEKSVELYLAADCSLLTSFESNATRAGVSPNAAFVIAVNKEGRVEKEIVNTGKIERNTAITIKDVPGIASVIISPNGKLVYIGTYDGKVWCLNTGDLSTVYTIDVESSVSCLKCNQDGELLAIGTEHPDFSIVNAQGTKVFPRRDAIPGVPSSFAFSSDSTTLAMGFWNGQCGVYSTKDGVKKWAASVKR